MRWIRHFLTLGKPSPIFRRGSCSTTRLAETWSGTCRGTSTSPQAAWMALTLTMSATCCSMSPSWIQAFGRFGDCSAESWRTCARRLTVGIRRRSRGAVRILPATKTPQLQMHQERAKHCHKYPTVLSKQVTPHRTSVSHTARSSALG